MSAFGLTMFRPVGCTLTRTPSFLRFKGIRKIFRTSPNFTSNNLPNVTGNVLCTP
eukprot:jgi/Botrbrau1/16935/Bobra.49_2s0004.1